MSAAAPIPDLMSPPLDGGPGESSTSNNRRVGLRAELASTVLASQTLRPNALAALETYKVKDASKGGSSLNHSADIHAEYRERRSVLAAPHGVLLARTVSRQLAPLVARRSC